MNIVVIGLGGIGGALAPVLARYLDTRAGPRSRLTLVDGDVYRPHNRARQGFRSLGNKARVTAETLAREFESVSIRTVEDYVSEHNVAAIVPSASIVLLAVDNHATRRVLSIYCESLSDVVLLSGGNELTDGNVQVFVRANGRNETAPLTAFHVEIAQPQDRSPDDQGCGVLVDQGEPQLLFTNLAVASALLNAFYTVVVLGEPAYDEVYLDIRRARMVPVTRRPR
jgi:molybdopterin/thiamine biosynthesis adenylyltransferase